MCNRQRASSYAVFGFGDMGVIRRRRCRFGVVFSFKPAATLRLLTGSGGATLGARGGFKVAVLGNVSAGSLTTKSSTANIVPVNIQATHVYVATNFQ